MNKIIRNKNNGYSVINNHCLRNKNISEKAKGVFAIIMSLPDNWDFSINGLISICHGGETAIRSAIKELIEHGYCERNVSKDLDTKKILGWEYTFSEKPLCDFPQVDFPQVGFPNMGNQVQLSTEELIPKKEKKERLNKKEQYLFNFDSDFVSIVNKRPAISNSIFEWIDYKFDIIKKPYITVKWLSELKKYSDNQIIESIRIAIAKEYAGFFPESVKPDNNKVNPMQSESQYTKLDPNKIYD